MKRVLLLGALALAAAGCGGGSHSAATETPTTTTAPASTQSTTTAGRPAEQITLRVYFLHEGQVAAAQRTAMSTPAVARAALQELIAGPIGSERAAGLSSDVPANSELRSVKIERGLATVDLSHSFAEGAEATITPRLAQVVYTLTQFPTVSRVAFELEGKPMETVTDGTGILVDHPVGRTDYEPLTPPILLETPTPGDTIKTPLRIAGTANTFEATFQVDLQDANGKVIVHKTVTATSGSGTRGTFAETIPFDAEPGPARVVVYENSAENGSRIHELATPVQIGD
jgi:germination protein M